VLTEEQRTELGPVLAEILEDAAFIFARVVADLPPERADTALYVAELQIGSTPSLHLLVATSPGLAAEVAANMLGVELEDDKAAELAADAVRELVNVVGGRLVNQWFGHASTLEISVPQIAQSSMGQLRARVGKHHQLTTLVTMSGEWIYIACVKAEHSR